MLNRWVVGWMPFALLGANHPLMAQGALSITTTSLPYAVEGTPYSATLNATGGAPPYTWSLVNTALSTSVLPAGLTLGAATGNLGGTPALANYCPASSCGVSSPSFGFQVTDSKGVSAIAELRLVVYDPLVITPSSLPQGVAGVSYLQCIGTTGGMYGHQGSSASLTSGSLPQGLSFQGNPACINGIFPGGPGISGTPTQTGTFPIAITATDNVQTVTKNFTLVIVPAPSLAVSPASLAFQYQFGGPAAAPQTVMLTLPSGFSATYSTAVSTTEGGTWLSVYSSGPTPSGGLTPSNTLQVSASPATTQTGTFSGTIRITSSQIANSPVTIPVT